MNNANKTVAGLAFLAASVLSVPSAEASASDFTGQIIALRYKQPGKTIKMARWFYKAEPNKPQDAVAVAGQFAKEEQGKLNYYFDKNLEPGFYASIPAPVVFDGRIHLFILS